LRPGTEPGDARLFFALWPGEEVRDRLAGWSRALRERCGGRATQAQDLHLTLAFLGSVAPDRVGEAERAAAEAVVRPATLVLDRAGFWKHNRIVWAGASSAPAALEDLVRTLREALTRAGVAFDSKGFVSHVTLLRDARAPAALPLLEPIPWDLDGFVLASSAPRAGARYRILRAWAGPR
jgi:2'-5' RNA ligase